MKAVADRWNRWDRLWVMLMLSPYAAGWLHWVIVAIALCFMWKATTAEGGGR